MPSFKPQAPQTEARSPIGKLADTLRGPLVKTLAARPADAWTLFAEARSVAERALFAHWQAQNHEWFDHRIDYLRRPTNLFWVERGVFGRAAIPPGGKVLDLCCGDGYFSFHFFQSAASQIDAVDANNDAITHARAHHAAPNIRYILRDLLADPLPGKGYDTVLFFEAIEHFSVEGGQAALQKIHDALKPGGTLVGSTPIFEAKNSGANWQHDNEFTSLAELDAFVGQVFPERRVFQTVHPARTVGWFEATKPVESGKPGK